MVSTDTASPPRLRAPAAYVRPAAILACLCGVLLAEAAWFQRTNGITFDETFYLSCGLQTVHDRRLDPRLAQSGVAPLPVLVDYVPPLIFAPTQERPNPWLAHPGDRALIDGPRLINTLVGGVAIVAVVFVWLYRRRGLAAASFGAGMVGLSPTIVAHASIATTDAMFASFSVVALAALAWYLRAPTGRRLVVLAVATSAAMSAKYSGVFLVPTVAILLLAHGFVRRSGSPRPAVWGAIRSTAGTFVLFLCLLVVAWWGFHVWSFAGPLKASPVEQTAEGSGWAKLFGRSPVATRFLDLAHRRLKRPSPLEGVLYQYSHNQRGHRGYLMGQGSRTGWWYYYPYAFAFKSTPSELILAGGLLIGLVASGRRPLRFFRDTDISLQVILVAAAVFTLMLLTSKIALGHRYLIVLYPLIAIAGSDRLFAWLPRRYAILVAIALLGGHAASNLTIAPHFLAYFNAPSGGPEHARELLVDSNLDWGQGLPALRDLLRNRGETRVAIAYFGTADLADHGVTAERIDELSRDPDRYDLLAISATHLVGVYADGENPFRAFRGLPPAAQAGYSILIFELDTAEKRAAFRQAVEELRRRPIPRY